MAQDEIFAAENLLIDLDEKKGGGSGGGGGGMSVGQPSASAPYPPRQDPVYPPPQAGGYPPPPQVTHGA